MKFGNLDSFSYTYSNLGGVKVKEYLWNIHFSLPLDEQIKPLR